MNRFTDELDDGRKFRRRIEQTNIYGEINSTCAAPINGFR